MDESKPVPPQDPPKDARDGDLPRQTSPLTAPNNSPDPQALTTFERAAMEMAERSPPPKPHESVAPQENKRPSRMKPAGKVESAAGGTPVKPAAPAAAFKLVEQYELTGAPFAAAPIDVTSTTPTLPAVRPMFDDTFRLRLTWWQSALLGLAIAILLLGAFGIAAYTFVVAHGWGCRAGLVEKYCPPQPQPKPLPQPEIPS